MTTPDGARPRRAGRADVVLGLFAAVQTFVFLGQRDGPSLLLWWTAESWLLVTLLWLKNLALAALAYFVFLELSRRTPVDVDENRHGFGAAHALLFTAILGAGVALRWIAPAQIPPGVWHDSIREAEAVLRHPGGVPWLGGERFGADGEGWALVSHLYARFCGLLFVIFGRGDVGILALSAVGGTLALLAGYWLGREAGGPRTALVGMGLLAFAMPPLVFSRWGYTASTLLPLVLAAAAAALRADATGRIGWAVLAGALVGLSLHTYVAAWPIAAALGVFFLTRIRRRRWTAFTLAAGAAALVAFLPFALAYFEFRDRLGGRAREVSFLTPSETVDLPGGDGPLAVPLRLLYNVVQYTGAVLWSGDPNPRNGIPGRPAFSAAIGIAALVGCVLAWKRARLGETASRLLLLLAGASLLAGILSRSADAPNAVRIYPMLAIATVFAAGVLVRWVPAAARVLSVRPGVLWALGLCLLFVLETLPFLTKWSDHPLVAGSFCPDESTAGRILRELGSAPTLLAPNALGCPVVFETLAAGEDPARPVPYFPRAGAADLLRSPPEAAFWYVARADELDVLRAAGWRISPKSRAEERERAVLVRAMPPGAERRAFAQDR